MSNTIMSATQVMFLPALICLLAALFKNCSTDLAKFDRMMARRPRRKPLGIGDNHVKSALGLVAVKWRKSDCGSIDANSDSLSKNVSCHSRPRFTVTCCRIILTLHTC